ncbi:SdrD B-like domain-containing protein [Larkinella sp. VNQ87]|uniref:SdrD B-like domain-containing protein n=1 Tax=Larkinella sp. VNQ87 TaxID=3400921 RepID=UPI003BFDC2D7
MKYLYTGLLTALCVGWTLIAFGQPSGQVWQDVNANGRRDGSETGVASISVKAYDRKGQLVAETHSESDGRYHLAIPNGQPIRLTFGNLPAGLTPLPGHYLHQFIKSSPLEVNLALYQPQVYMGNSPRMALSMQPLGNHKAGESDTLSSVIIVDALKNRKESKLWAKPVITGSIWSLAFDRAKQRLFSAALAKRHSGFGSLGSGGIYVTDLISGQTKPFVDLGKMGIVTGPNSLERDLSSDLREAMVDSLMYPWVAGLLSSLLFLH